MSIQNLLKPNSKNENWTKVYAKEINTNVNNCDIMNCSTINMPSGADINAHDVVVDNELKVIGNTDIGGNNYVTANLGLPNYVLKTDGAGNTRWDVDAGGGGIYDQSLNTFDDVEFKSLKINNNYTFPTNLPSSNQIIKSDAVGNLTWENETIGNPFNQDLNTTDNVTFNSVNSTTSVQCAGLGIGEFPTANLSIKSALGQDCEIKLDTTDDQDCLLSFKNQGVDKWDIRNEAPNDDLVISDSSGDAIVRIKKSDNSVEITEDGVSNGLLICDSINTQAIVNNSNTLINIAASDTTFETDIVSSTGNKIFLNGTDNPPLLVPNPVVINLPSAGVFGAGLILKIIDVGGNAQVTPVLPTDDDSIPVIGVSLNAPNAVNSLCQVAIGGTFEAVIQNLSTVSPGFLCEKSDVVGQDGRAAPTIASQGSVLVALTSATGNAAGTNKALFMFKKSESF